MLVLVLELVGRPARHCFLQSRCSGGSLTKICAWGFLPHEIRRAWWSSTPLASSMHNASSQRIHAVRGSLLPPLPCAHISSNIILAE